jgi:hypothetical protein
MRSLTGCLAAFLTLALSACVSSWRTETVPPARVIQRRGPTELRVRRADGRFLVLQDPAVGGDSITGWEAPPWDKAGGLTRRAIPLEEVRSIAVRTNDVAANAVLGFLAGTLAFGYLVLLPVLGSMR